VSEDERMYRASVVLTFGNPNEHCHPKLQGLLLEYTGLDLIEPGRIRHSLGYKR
jgi:hypothetical protein